MLSASLRPAVHVAVTVAAATSKQAPGGNAVRLPDYFSPVLHGSEV